MDFTFLTEEQIFGEKQLEVLKKYGTKCAISDFSILLGGAVSDFFYTNEEEHLKNRTGWWWSKTPVDNDACAVDSIGDSHWYNVHYRKVGCRPALPYSVIQSISSNEVRGANGVVEVECFEWPQTVVSKAVEKELEKNFKRGKLLKTEVKYPADSIAYDKYDTDFKLRTFDTYFYNDKKYIRFIGDSNGKEQTLSNGEAIKEGKPYWIEVEPIKWLISEKENIALAKIILFSGVQFNKERNYKGDFNNTNIKKFLDQYFAKVVNVPKNFQVAKTIESSKEPRKTRLQKMNPDETKAEERVKMTDTELIHNWIESGQSVLLRGPSGIGKTERIKSLYPDLIYLKLTNNMFPEKVVGSINLQTGQSIPPDFYKEAMLRCASEEEKKLIQENIQNLNDLADTLYERSKKNEKKIVLLLDELLNVKPTVQGLVYTLVLNRLIEMNGGLKLPENVVIVATGNQKKYSNIAQDLAEPLEKRFDHIFDMEPKVGEWLFEFAIPNKVHPQVIHYILSKYLSTGKSERIEDISYFYEEPEVGEEQLDKWGCKGRTNDPRGWVSISNTLYLFEKNLKAGKYSGKDVEDILKISIHTKLREYWAEEFFSYYNQMTLSVEDVVNKNYTQTDLPRDSNERYALVSALLFANELEVAECRKFIKEYCDPEYRDLYDLCWIGKDEKRMEFIYELKERENMESLEIKEGVSR